MIKELLSEHAVHVRVQRIKRIQKEQGTRCKQIEKFKATTNSNYAIPVAEDILAQNFVAYAPNHVWIILPQPKAGSILPAIETFSPVRSLDMQWERE